MSESVKEVVDRRGYEWAVWRDQTIRLTGRGFGRSCLVNLGIPIDRSGHDDGVPVSDIRAMRFDAAWRGLPLELRMVVEVHYCGYGVTDDEAKARLSSTPREKAEHCELTVRTFYRRLDQARERLHFALVGALSTKVLHA